MTFMTTVFLFHRDLRVSDNTGLNKIIRDYPDHELHLVFVFDPVQVDRKKNEYFSNAALQFICESLREIRRLNVLYGDTVRVLKKLHEDIGYQALYQNADKSLFARERDASIEKACESLGVRFENVEDYYLYDDDNSAFLTRRPEPYRVFAPFYRACIKRGKSAVRRPDNDVLLPKLSAKYGNVDLLRPGKLYEENPDMAQRGGRKNGEILLNNLLPVVRDYGETRNVPGDVRGTTRSSAHIKFGTISVREFFWKIVDSEGTMDHPLIRELLFREFYRRIYEKRPELQRGVAFDVRDKKVPWKKSPVLFRAWTTGRTGFPFVDAGMRELMKTNWMHNRARMVTGSFATKYCLMDWRDCAKFFYRSLVDADIFSNTAGWGFVSSTGVDPQPWFRYPMNPFLQSKKFDRDASYIKTYVPELREVSASDIHRWNEEDVRKKYPSIDYPKPIVKDYMKNVRMMIQSFSKSKN